MSNVFISYRREDSAPYAGRLCDRLSTLFGPDSVFMDVQDIRPGQDFTQTIQETIGKCHVLIAVIGPRWLKSLKERAQTRQDFVEDEIAEALRRGLTVIPVLVGGARMPGVDEVPQNLQPLSRHQAVEIRDSRFDDDFAQLTDVLRMVPGLVMAGTAPKSVESLVPAGKLKWFAGAAGVVVAVLLYLLLRPGAPELNGAWMAEMHKAGQPSYRIRLELVTGDGKIKGTVEYPTGTGVIGNGTLNGPRLTFQTVHTPQFESSPATIRFDGRVLGDTIQLTMVNDSGVATGIAQRISPASPK